MRNLSPYSWRKEMPEELETPILKALMHFPELQTRKIIFRYAKKPFSSVLKAKPRLRTILRVGEERTYVVKMNRELRLGQTTMHLAQLPEAVLVGWFGHELGHINDYEERSNRGLLLKEIILKVSSSYSQKMGIKADRVARRHGLRAEIRKAKEFILKRALISSEYKKQIRAFYPGLRQIMQLIRKEKRLEPIIS